MFQRDMKNIRLHTGGASELSRCDPPFAPTNNQLASDMPSSTSQALGCRADTQRVQGDRCQLAQSLRPASWDDCRLHAAHQERRCADL